MRMPWKDAPTSTLVVSESARHSMSVFSSIFSGYESGNTSRALCIVCIIRVRNVLEPKSRLTNFAVTFLFASDIAEVKVTSSRYKEYPAGTV